MLFRYVIGKCEFYWFDNIINRIVSYDSAGVSLLSYFLPTKLGIYFCSTKEKEGK